MQEDFILLNHVEFPIPATVDVETGKATISTGDKTASFDLADQVLCIHVSKNMSWIINYYITLPCNELDTMYQELVQSTKIIAFLIVVLSLAIVRDILTGYCHNAVLVWKYHCHRPSRKQIMCSQC